jgi:hypothetical protein
MKKRNWTVLGVFIFIFIFAIAPAKGEPPAKPGNKGLPACLDTVNQLKQTLSELENSNLNYAPVAQTGEKICNDSDGRYDGCLQKGVKAPVPRFTDNNDGTVNDNLTRLVWMKNMGCWEQQNLYGALALCDNLAEGECGVMDGSVKGDWRLPNRNELMSLIDIGTTNGMVISDGNPFKNYCGGPPEPGFPCGDRYWSSSSATYNFGEPAYFVHFGDGSSGFNSKSTSLYGTWCVRDPK